jgi:hypothetical protein
VGDLDLTGLGLGDHRDGDGERAAFVGGRDLVAIEALPEEQLAADSKLGYSSLV